MRDEGGPLGVGVQAQIPNRLLLLRSRGAVVSEQEKGRARPVRYEPKRRTQVNR